MAVPKDWREAVLVGCGPVFGEQFIPKPMTRLLRTSWSMVTGQGWVARIALSPSSTEC